MLIRRVELRGFMSHDSTELELPETGVVVLLGDNGAGKSSLVEAVSYAGWGRTLRGESPWRAGQAGEVGVDFDGVGVSRVCTKSGKQKVHWSEDGVEVAQADTLREAQRRLDALLGEHDRWRRTHVFSSADAFHFSIATDAERKRLVEQVVGLGVFDEALARCRADAGGIELSQQVLGSDRVKAELRLVAERARLEGMAADPAFEEEPEPEEPPEGDEVAAAELRERLADLQGRGQVAHARAGRVVSAGVAAEVARLAAEKAHAERHLEMTAAGRCGECGRGFKAADKVAAEVMAAQARSAYQVAVNHQEQDRREVDRVRAEARAELGRVRAEVALVEHDLRQLDAAAAVHARWTAQLQQWEARQERRRSDYAVLLQLRVSERAAAQRRVAELEMDLDDFYDRAAALEVELAELRVCDKVLGPRGLRASVLGAALRGVEAVANGWLARMAPGMAVHLDPFTETKTAGFNECLALVVSGAGGGLGYRACSGGERRRIDVAVLMGLAEVASAAEGRERDGTLLVDEAFDALDAAGCEAVAECLGELGQRRPVVVVTHREELAGKIVAAAKYRVEAGKVRRV
jgi:exonuclease SbcC